MQSLFPEGFWKSFKNKNKVGVTLKQETDAVFVLVFENCLLAILSFGTRAF
jgi:hypothetical protein